jgi:rubredoxin
MTKYRCKVCGHIQDNNVKCEVCQVEGPENFEVVKEEKK